MSSDATTTATATATTTEEDVTLSVKGHALKVDKLISASCGRLVVLEDLFESMAGQEMELVIQQPDRDTKSSVRALPLRKILGDQAYQNLVSLTWSKLDHERLKLMELFEGVEDRIREIEKA